MRSGVASLSSGSESLGTAAAEVAAGAALSPRSSEKFSLALAPKSSRARLRFVKECEKGSAKRQRGKTYLSHASAASVSSSNKPRFSCLPLAGLCKKACHLPFPLCQLTPRNDEVPVANFARAAWADAMNCDSVTPRRLSSSSAVSGPRLTPDASPVDRKIALWGNNQSARQALHPASSSARRRQRTCPRLLRRAPRCHMFPD